MNNHNHNLSRVKPRRTLKLRLDRSFVLTQLVIKLYSWWDERKQDYVWKQGERGRVRLRPGHCWVFWIYRDTPRYGEGGGDDGERQCQSISQNVYELIFVLFKRSKAKPSSGFNIWCSITLFWVNELCNWIYVGQRRIFNI